MLKHKWLVISLFLIVSLAIFRYNSGIVQQDNYLAYARILPTSVGSISFFESRLLPGLPVLIYLVRQIVQNYYLAGYVVTVASFIGSYFLLYKITGSKLSVLPLVFPPILLNLATLIDTEFPFIFLMLLGVYFLKKNKFPWAFLIIGISVWFRLAGMAVIFGIFVYFLIRKELGKFLKYTPYFLVPVVLLLLFNTHFFGSRNLFYQIFTYEKLHPGRISIGFIQLGSDLLRAFRWGWYRILFSGLAYIALFTILWVKSVKIRHLEFWTITGIYIFTLLVNLVPFLENLGRYLAPTAPLFWIIFYKKLGKEGLLYLLLPLSALAVLI
jgi:hypothetical protein